MPVEIRELVIRAVVDPKGERPAPAGSAASVASASDEREAIVAAAVAEVLRILRAAQER